MMELKNMETFPKEVSKALAPYLEKLLKKLGGNVVSVIVHGSVTGTDYDPKTSDMNVAVVLRDSSITKLKPLLKDIRAGARRRIPAPLFMTPGYIRMSLDTFPMEFMMMKNAGKVVYGEDVLSGLSFEREDLRRECEYQLKGKLVTIRQAYLEKGLARKGLEELIKASLRSLIPVFYAMLTVKTGQYPELKKQDVLLEAGKEFDLDVSAFIEVLADKKSDGKIAGNDAEIFLSGFLAQLDKMSEIIDNL